MDTVKAKMNNKYSVIIPVYNRANRILPTLKSVQDQDYDNFEVIIVDDGSSDSEELRQVVQDMKDNRFKYVRQENEGAASARNMGIRMATGDYIAFLDSDDLYLGNKLSEINKHVTGESALNNKNIVFSSAQYVDRGVGRLWIKPSRAINNCDKVSEYMLCENQPISPNTLVMSKSLASAVLFNPAMRQLEDVDFCIRLEHYGAQFHMIDKPLAISNDKADWKRLSQQRSQRRKEVEEWLLGLRHIVPRRAYYGGRATRLSYYSVGSNPFRTLYDLAMGVIAGGVPFPLACKQTVRSLLPRRLYRRIVNTYVSFAGQKR